MALVVATLADYNDSDVISELRKKYSAVAVGDDSRNDWMGYLGGTIRRGVCMSLSGGRR